MKCDCGEGLLLVLVKIFNQYFFKKKLIHANFLSFENDILAYILSRLNRSILEKYG